MKVLLAGGGTAGHIIPLRSVARKLKSHYGADITVEYVGERNARFADIMAGCDEVDGLHQIHSGKLRRYHDESWLQRLTDFRTIALNVRDVLFVVLGFFESLRLLRRSRPDVVFLKGGFVAVPIGLAAALYKIPYVTHDSDAVPGLANRLVARWASYHAVAMPKDLYPYPASKTVQTGVIVDEAFDIVSVNQKNEFRNSIGVPSEALLLLVSGGSSGAAAINRVMAKTAGTLLNDFDSLYIIHQAGRGKTDKLYQEIDLENYGDRLRVVEYIDNFHEFSGAADVIVSRAGATTLADIGMQARACIVIPAPHLTGGQQLINAAALENQSAVIVLQEADVTERPEAFVAAVTELLNSKPKREAIGAQLCSITAANALDEVVKLIVRTAHIHNKKDSRA